MSYHFIAVWHRGQRELGATMDMSSGMRRMQTFRKLPITSPNTKMKAMTKMCGAQASVCNVPQALLALNARAEPECPMPNASRHSRAFVLCVLCALRGKFIDVGFFLALLDGKLLRVDFSL